MCTHVAAAGERMHRATPATTSSSCSTPASGSLFRPDHNCMTDRLCPYGFSPTGHTGWPTGLTTESCKNCLRSREEHGSDRRINSNVGQVREHSSVDDDCVSANRKCH